MALVWGDWTFAAGHSSGNTVQEDFGPFDIGPGLRDRGRGGQREESMEEIADVWGSELERVWGGIRTPSDHEITLCCPPYGS